MSLNDGRVVSNLIIQALQNKAITIYGNGKQTRSFCYVDDLINALIIFMNISNDFIGPVNLGNPNEITILELAETIIDLTNSKSQLEFQSLSEDDLQRRCPYISLAKENLNCKSTISLKEDLIKTQDYIEEILKNETKEDLNS